MQPDGAMTNTCSINRYWMKSNTFLLIWSVVTPDQVVDHRARKRNPGMKSGIVLDPDPI